MQITFLAASDGTPIAKSFQLSNGALTAQNYPMVRDFNSFHPPFCNTIEEAYDIITAHAGEGHCILKGTLDAPLVNESRAGRVASTAMTDYIVLDLDFEDGFESIDDFLSQIGLGDVSYILHHSSGAGIKYKAGLRSHVIMGLENKESPPLLKYWLMAQNLALPSLDIKLNATKLGLDWPLDISTCENSKLITIAEPIVHEGVIDTMAGKRWELHIRNRARASIDLRIDPSLIADQVTERINALRQGLGLRQKTPRNSKNEGILLNPDRAIVTGYNEARGFTYLNLNGGDSWAYYFPNNNPEILYNFKGDPPVRLQDLAPDFYREIKQRQIELDVINPEKKCFIARHNPTDTFYTCIYDPNANKVELAPAARSHLADFLSHHNEPMPEFVPQWDIEFDPTTTKVYDENKQWINTFSPSIFMTETHEQGPFPTITRVLKSLCGTNEYQDHFLNWVAYIFQTRQKPMTAHIFSGIEGTGKGVLFNQILSPLFGQEYCVMTTVDALNDSFNEWAERCLLLGLDEFKIEARDAKRIPERLRNLITEPYITIRGMRKNRRTVKSHLSVLIFTNSEDPMKIPASDRRYNVAPRQHHKLQLTQEDINAIKNELPFFANYLHAYPANANRAQSILVTKDKELMREASEGTMEKIYMELRNGNLQFFSNFMRKPAGALKILSPEDDTYNRIIRSWAENQDVNAAIPLREIQLVISYVGEIKTPPSLLRIRRNLETHYGLETTKDNMQVYVNFSVCEMPIENQTPAHPPPIEVVKH